MQLKKTILLCIFCLFTVLAYAQKSKSHSGSKSVYTQKRYNSSAARVKGSKAKIVCPVFEQSRYPYSGIGIKLGDPFAITYKYYASKNFSIAADLGKPASGLYNRYFREKFDEYQDFDTLSDNATVTYLTHKVKTDFIAEIKLLYQFDAKKISPGLQFYVGAGWEWRNSRIQYDYLYEREPSITNPEPANTAGTVLRNRFTQGVQGVVGIEYSYFQIPLSAFMELEYFTDLQADPGWRRVEGGVGLRYIF